ncbi:hypothetical protein BA894_23535 [Vibrio natriegens]|uniref:esterase/lipase family protein n=1 Tax=Vibrio natriegens TaxID=691 RepID=UPI000804624E|nr:alpha/beta hydrolase [Vibrio natriegens]ANQ29353.1 hypothetical protein BA894_23535 [Vibrio natriegens]
MRLWPFVLVVMLGACSSIKQPSNLPLAEWQQQGLTTGWLTKHSQDNREWPVIALANAEPQQNLKLYNALLKYLLTECLNGKGPVCNNVKISCEPLCKGLSVPHDTVVSEQTIGVSGYHFRPRVEGIEAFYPIEGVYQPVTFISWPNHQGVEIKLIYLYDLDHPPTFMGIPLKQDYVMPYKELLANATIQQYETTGVFQSKDERYFGIYRLQPLDLNKDIVLMIHGLNSSPVIWSAISKAILSRPSLVERYQIWHAYYETGSPPFYNAKRVRTALQKMLIPFYEVGKRPRITVVGHSMGGIITKILATDSNELLWNTTFNVSYPYLVNLFGPVVDDARNILYFHPVEGINKIIFIDTPHRGAKLSKSWLARIMSIFISLPKKLLSTFSFSKNMQGIVSSQMAPYLQAGVPPSIDVLQSDHPLTHVFSEMVPDKRIDAWSVIGNNVEGCFSVEKMCANDGVVDYLSAHQKYAPEIIVKSKHNSYRHPDTIDLVLKILSNIK